MTNQNWHVTGAKANNNDELHNDVDHLIDQLEQSGGKRKKMKSKVAKSSKKSKKSKVAKSSKKSKVAKSSKKSQKGGAKKKVVKKSKKSKVAKVAKVAKSSKKSKKSKKSQSGGAKVTKVAKSSKKSKKSKKSKASKKSKKSKASKKSKSQKGGNNYFDSLKKVREYIKSVNMKVNVGPPLGSVIKQYYNNKPEECLAAIKSNPSTFEKNMKKVEAEMKAKRSSKKK
jgi:hypothetical protein